MVMNFAAIPNVAQPAPAPYLGLTRDERTTLSYVPQLGGEPTVFKPAAYDPFSRDPTMAYLARVTGGAVGTGNDPATWTPEEAAGQTDRALARIGTANPELAKSLAEQRGKTVDEDLPWYKDIMKGVGDFLHATKLDVVFDYLGRSAKIVPEIIHDWGKEEVWENIGDALSGKSTISWDDVLVDNFGMERSWLTATLGFIGDVATDPLTFTTFGMGGIGRAAVGKTVGEAGIAAAFKRGSIKVSGEARERLLKAGINVSDDGVLNLSVMRSEILAGVGDVDGEFVKAVLAKGGTVEDAIGKAVYSLTDVGKELAEKGASGIGGRLRAAFGGVHPDARSGALFVADNMASREALLEVVRLQDDLVRQATTGGWQRASKEFAEKLGIGKAETDAILKSYVAQGTGVGVSKAAYREGKAAAAALGGARLRFSIPVLNIRAAGMRLPMFPRNMDFSIGRRFFAGISGQVRLSKMVGNGQATMEDMRLFWEEGFSGLKKKSPRVYNELGKGVRSAFFTASEGLGNATAHLSPHAMQLRGGGLAAKYAGETRIQAKHIWDQTTDEIQTVTLVDQVGAQRVVTRREVEQRVGKGKAVAGDRFEELTDSMNEYANLVPEPGASAAQYWDARIATFKQHEDSLGTLQTDRAQEALAAMEHDKARAIAAEAKIRELSGDAELPEIWKQTALNRNAVLNNAGRSTDQHTDTVLSATDMPTEDARRLSDGVVYESDQVTGSSAIGVEELSDNGVTGVAARGVRARPVGHIDDPIPPARPDAVAAPNPRRPAPLPGLEPGKTPKYGSLDEAEAAEAAIPARPDDIQTLSSKPLEDEVEEAGAGFAANLERNIAKREAELAEAAQPKVHPKPNTNNTPEANAKVRQDLADTFEAAADEDYGYHWGPRTAHESRKAKGLLPSVPADADIAGGFPSGVYFGKNGKRAYDLTSPKKAKDAILYRVRKDRLAESPSENADEFVSEQAIDAADVEYLAADGTWKPLAEAGTDLGDDVEALSTYHFGLDYDEVPGTAVKYSADDTLPAVPKGHTRLYRGGRGDGRWWTSSKDEARLYAERGEGGGNDLFYRDVPDESLPPARGASGALKPPKAADEAAAPPMEQAAADVAAVLENNPELQALADKLRMAAGNGMIQGPVDVVNFLKGRNALTPEAIEVLRQYDAWDQIPELAAAAAKPLNDSPAAAVVALDPELQRAVEANLDELTPTEKAWQARPRMVRTGPDNILNIDRSPAKAGQGGTQATEVIDPVAEIHDTIRPILDDIEAGVAPQLDNLSDEATEALKRIVGTVENKEKQLADITTMLLKEQGYTGLRIKVGEAEELVLFMDDATGHVPFSRVNDRAPFIPDHGGPQLRAVTEGAREAVQGLDRRAGDRLIQKILRKVRDLPRDQAEKRARELLDEAHITLRPEQRFFESDPLRVLEESTNDAARQVAEQFTGEAIRHAENLGLTRGAYGAGQVGLGRYRVVVSENGIDLANVLGKQWEAAAKVIAEYSGESGVEVLGALARRMTEEANEVEASLRELRDDVSSGKAAALREIRRRRERAVAFVDKEGNELPMYTPEEITRNIEAKNAEFSALRTGAKPLPKGETLEQVGDVAEDGSAIWLRREPRPGGEEKLTFYHVSGDGTVNGYRDVQLPGDAWSKHMRYADNERRLYGTATTMRALDAGGQGIGAKLHDAHWKEVGVFEGTPQEQFAKMEKAIGVQELSESGAKLNVRAVEARAKDINKEEAAKAKDLARRAKEATEKANDASIAVRDAIAEQGKLKYRASNERSPILAALVPIEDAANMTGMATLRVPGFQEFKMPAFMAEEFEGAMRGFPKLEGAHLAFRKFNNWWKQFATWLVPGFHMRNIQGAFFNNWLGGVGLRDYITSSRIRYAERELVKGKPAKWAKSTIKKTDPELYQALVLSEPSGMLMGRSLDQLTYADLAHLSSGLNLTASNGRAFAEAMLSAEARTQSVAKATKARRGYVDRVAAPYVKTMRGAGTMTENVFRTASFVRGLREGRGIMESRAFTMMRHGDYEDLTDFEYTWVRDLIPFYKWMRTNTPFQVHQLLESPGKLLAVQKGQQAVYAGQGLDYEVEKHRMPAWMGEGFTIPFNKKKTEEGLDVYETVMLDLPMSDLFMGGREFVSSFLPTIRPFLESYVYKQQTFSGAPLTGKQIPLNPLLAPLAPVLDAVGLAKRGNDGQMYMSDKTSNLIGILPLYSRFKNFVYGDKDAVTRRSNTLASAMFGLQLRPVDAQNLSSAELSFYYDQILPTMTSLREQGYPLPTTDDLESTIGATDNILTSLGIQPGPVGAEAA